jgi:hypothetical protein
MVLSSLTVILSIAVPWGATVTACTGWAYQWLQCQRMKRRVQDLLAVLPRNEGLQEPLSVTDKINSEP